MGRLLTGGEPEDLPDKRINTRLPGIGVVVKYLDVFIAILLTFRKLDVLFY
jgi:hypothetical protein